MKLAIAALATIAGTTVSAQTLTAVAANPANNNYVTEVISVDSAYDGAAMLNTWSPGDMFGRTNVTDGALTSGGLPFAILDESTSTFPADVAGIIDGSTDFGDFFGVVDTVNGSNVSGGTASYTWANPGGIVDSVSIDMAAMGDFEANADLHLFEISTDGGGTFSVLGLNTVNEDISNIYTVASGATNTFDDPMFFNGQLLTNNFSTISFNGLGLAVTGDVILRYSGQTDGGTEAYAWRNANVNLVPAPASAALLGLGGIAAVRRRR